MTVKDKEELKKIIEQAKITDNLNYLNVSGITNMEGLFRGNSFNGDISKWDVSNVTHMNHMFHTSKFQGDISDWKIENVRFMVGMFADSDFFKNRNHLLFKWEIAEGTRMQQFAMDINSVSEFKKRQEVWKKLEGLGYLKNLFNLK